MKLLEHYDTQYALYPRKEEVYIDRIEPTGKDSIAIGVVENGERKDYELSFATQSEQTLRVGVHQYITLCYTPKSHYEMLGSSQSGVIVIKHTNIPLQHPMPVEAWMPKFLPSELLKYKRMFKANDAWGLLCEIRANLQEHLGTPSDEAQKDGPGLQYVKALDGKYRLQCNNIVDIFVFACACKGIIARRINLWQGPGVWPQEAVQKFGAALYTAQGHTTAEVYNPETKKWDWMDPMWGITAFAARDLLELRRSLNLIVMTYDNRSCLLYEHESYESWVSYLNPHQRISYVLP